MTEDIRLIVPPSPFLMDERVFVSLGILRVAASLESDKRHVSIIDLSGISNYVDAVKDMIAGDCRVFGITATTPQMPAAFNIMKAIREVHPTARVMLGGPHPTLIAASAKYEKKRGLIDGRSKNALDVLMSNFDVVIAGDGELSILHAMKNPDLRFIDADDHSSSFFMSSNVHGAMPFPARHLIDMNSYNYSIDGVRATSIITQLGCPFQCGFCSGRSSPMLRHIRTRSIDNVIAELRYLYETYGYTGFMLYDDELNVNKNLVSLMNEISKLQRALGVDFKLRGFIKSELFTPEQARVMYNAGFRWVLIGFESGSGRILDNINKRATSEDNSRAIMIAKEAGLKVKALMSLGHPGESKDTADETRRWLIENTPDDFDITVITPYPGSPYYDEAVKVSDDIWSYSASRSNDKLYMSLVDYNTVADYYKGDPNDGYTSYVFTDHLSRDEIVKIRKDIEFNVRSALGIPFPNSVAAVKYEHSMGANIHT